MISAIDPIAEIERIVSSHSSHRGVRYEERSRSVPWAPAESMPNPAWAIERGETATKMLELPFYHPTFEVGRGHTEPQEHFVGKIVE